MISLLIYQIHLYPSSSPKFPDMLMLRNPKSGISVN